MSQNNSIITLITCDNSCCSCFLNTETHFIWAFIGPVILIFLTNIGFLIMAAVIMWRQQKKRNTKQKSSDVGGWLKAVITLMVVMGITWIIGLAVVEIEELLPLAYIFTIVAAFQGVSIFLVLVIFTKSVRDEIINEITKMFDKNINPHSSKVRTKDNYDLKSSILMYDRLPLLQ